MSDVDTLSRVGQLNGANDVKANFEEVYTGEMVTHFEATETLKSRTKTRTITHGKSAHFDALYKATGGYHTPGAELNGSSVLTQQVIINIDDLLVSDIFVASIDEAMNHFEVRSEYAKRQGQFLGLACDKNIARNLIISSDSDALFTGDTAGQQVTDTDARTSATSLAASFWDAKQLMEEAEVAVDQELVTAAVKPAQWYLLAQEPTLVLNKDVGGDGNYSSGMFQMIGGIDVIKSSAYPWGVDDSNNTALMASHRIDMTNTVAAVFTEDAVATVQLMGLAFEVVPAGRNRGDFLIAEYAFGHGPFVPKCSVEINTVAR